MVVRFLVSVTCGRAAVFLLPVGLFFVSAAEPARAVRVLGLASAFTIGNGLALWPSGRLLDTVGPWRGLRTSMLFAALSLSTVSAAASLGLPLAVLYTAAAISGGLCAPMIATPRALLPSLVAPYHLPRASGWEAAANEVALLLAPLAAALLSRWGSVWVLLGAAGLLGVGWLLFPMGKEPAAVKDRGGPLLTRRIVWLAGLAGLVGLGGGLLEPGLAALPPPLPNWGQTAALLFVALSAGSFMGGAVAAHVGWPRAGRHAVPLLLVHAACVVAAASATGPGRLLALVAAGAPIAPLTSLAGLLLDRWTSGHRTSETFAVIAATLVVSTGIGQALAAQLLDAVTPTELVLLSAVAPAGAAAFALTGRHCGGRTL